LYFAPFVPLFVLHRMWTEKRLRDMRTWAALTAAAGVTVLLTLPFLIPYQRAQQAFLIERQLGEVVNFSANVWSYVTASENLWLWGDVLRFYERPEGETFLGFVPWMMAFVALAIVIRQSRVPATRRRWLELVLLVLAVTQFMAMLSAVIFGGFDFRAFGMQIRARTVSRLLLQFAVTAGVLLAISPRLREQTRTLLRSPVVFFLAATVLAMWLSLGPLPRAGDSMVSGFGLYGVLYDYVPGFDGVRVPARYAMIAGLFLAILAGYGAMSIWGLSTLRLAVLACLVLVEGAAVPIEINRTDQAGLPARVFPRSQAPEVYQRIATLPGDAVITEFPFGERAWEIRYVFYAAAHWKPITNGYSGSFPPAYNARVARLQHFAADPDASWETLRKAGTTHVVIHRSGFGRPEDADAVEAWLKAHGAREIERFPEGDILLAL
jgi:hypothetical protein